MEALTHTTYVEPELYTAGKDFNRCTSSSKTIFFVYHATSQPVSLVQVKVVREGEREGWEWEGQKINAIIHSHELLLQAE